ncbi:hypothetical protein [Arthrobacter sp. A5]|uniref:hypothetical protein n=1 Tax=Arthrobacter sp. A5 TaxID=576926 RepID=UPI003DAA2448
MINEVPASPCGAAARDMSAQLARVRTPDGSQRRRAAVVVVPSAASSRLLVMDGTPSSGDKGLEDWSGPEGRFSSWLGPAHDGGFRALALHQPDGHLVRCVPMSTPTTGAHQLARLHHAGISAGLVPVLTDVDAVRAALKVPQECPGIPFADDVRGLTRSLDPLEDSI